MGNYNPHYPHIVGPEWVPLKNENIQFAPNFSRYEVGTTFTVDNTTDATFAAFVVDGMQPDVFTGVVNCHIYPLETAADTGPLETVIIPVSGIHVTGDSITVYTGNGPNGYTADVSLLNPSDFQAVEWDMWVPSGTSQGENRIWVTFDVTPFLPYFNQGKRIIDMNLLYTASHIDDDGVSRLFVYPLNSFGPQVTDPDDITYGEPSGTIRGTTDYDRDLGSQEYQRIPLGFVAEYYNHANFIRNVNVQNLNASQLTFFNTGNAAIYIEISDIGNTFDESAMRIILNSLSLEVSFCQETRIATGSVLFVEEKIFIQPGVNQTLLDFPAQFGNGASISAGNYLMTFSSSGYRNNPTWDTGRSPEIAGTRQLRRNDPHAGYQFNFPTPDRSAELVETDVLLPGYLATNGLSWNQNTHVYGRRINAQVFGPTSWSGQQIYGADGEYPYVRFYARKFGNVGPLTITGVTPTVTGSSGSITPEDFDELEELVDGYKEVTLTLTPPPTFTAANTEWAMMAPTTNGGARWEIIGAEAVTITGTGPMGIDHADSERYLTPERVNQGFSSLTTKAPHGMVSGGTYRSTSAISAWYPGTPPYVTAPLAIDPTVDLIMTFSQMPPQISGLSVTNELQELDGIFNCEDCCRITDMFYNRITWSPSTLSYVDTDGLLPGTFISGDFGRYELQRSDPYSGWQTIMTASDPAITGFNDYEAIIGYESQYRIRQLNVLDFAGNWSITGSAMTNSPGAAVILCGPIGVMTFTSNEHQNGSGNLAYTMTWNSNPVEEFTIEESTVGFVEFHDRDYRVAVRGLERDGESFQRQLLLTNAVVSGPPRRSSDRLKDLAWEDLPYICVRDSSGNRWFANVQVTNRTFTRAREIINVSVTITEVAGTPSVVEL